MADISASEPKIAYPAWTEYQSRNGIDPLGMQNSCVNLYQRLVPGIGNVTLRMRYYGLYAWLCRNYAKRIGSEDPELWKRQIRRAEALYALIARHIGGESGIAGINWAGNAYGAHDEPIDFANASDPESEIKYLKQAWGAYGAAYGSQLFEIGILWEHADHNIPICSDHVGDGLAVALEEEFPDEIALFVEVLEKGAVSREELDRLKSLAPGSIKNAGAEREFYQQIMLATGPAEIGSGLARRHSILLILHVAALLGHYPTADEVRWILYAGHSQEGAALQLDAENLETHRQRWWVYHANDLCHVALEALLKFTLDTLEPYRTGLELNRVIAQCVDAILNVAGNIPETWALYSALLEPSPNAFAEDDDETEWSLSRDILRGAGRSGDRSCSPEVAWKAVRLLAILQKRVRDEDHPVEEELTQFSSEAFQTLLTETRFLAQNETEPVATVIGRLIEQRVIRRHLWVAARKFQHGDYTFLFEQDEGRLKVREKDGPVFTNPRLAPTITFLSDIHLLDDSGPTKYGVAAMQAQ